MVQETKSAEVWLAELLDDGNDQVAVGAALMKEEATLRGQVIERIVASVTEDEAGPLWGLAYLHEDDRAIEALGTFATSGPGESRTTALGIFGVLRSKPVSGLPILLAALSDDDDDVVSEAAQALMAYPDPVSIAPLKEALTRAQQNPRWGFGALAGHLMTALAVAGPGRDDVIDVLIRNLEPAQRHAALPAFKALIAMKDEARCAVPTLEAIAQRADLYLATLARHALAAITGDYSRHIGALEAAAKSKEPAVQAVARAALKAAK